MTQWETVAYPCAMVARILGVEFLRGASGTLVAAINGTIPDGERWTMELSRREVAFRAPTGQIVRFPFANPVVYEAARDLAEIGAIVWMEGEEAFPGTITHMLDFVVRD